MNLFWDEEVPFISVFNGHHLFYIAGMIGLLLLMCTQHRKVKKHADQIRQWILLISIGQQVLLYSWYIFEMGFDVSESLPFHISRISSLLGIVYLFSKNNNILDVLFYFGLFAYGSFFYPSRVYPVYHVIGLSFFINHAITILLPVFAAIAYKWRPTFKGALKAYGWFLLYFLFVYTLNPLIDGNYFYLKYRSFFVDLPESLYIPLVLVATLAIFLLGYLLARFIIHFVTTEQPSIISEEE